MKIALCFAGQSRALEEGYEYYKRNLLDHYDVDVYVHSWSKKDEIISLYNPKAILVEQTCENEHAYDHVYISDPVKYPQKNNYRQFYSLYKCSQLIQGEYDWVIRTRTDYALNVVIPFKDLDNTKLYIPNCRMTPERDFGNDQFSFSSQENMMMYMSTFLNLEKYSKFVNQFCGEDLMQQNLYEHGLHGKNLVYVNMNNPFPPGRYNGTWHSLIRNDMEKWIK